MDAGDIEQAYAPFVAAVRAGGFRDPTPDEGWSAPMITAHVTLNNDHWTRAARDLIAGEPTAYDNETAVDDDVLRAHVRMADPDGLLADLQRSVRDLAAAFDDLGANGAREIPVRITHAGQVIVDRPAPLGDMIEGNATYHLRMHLEQLLALGPGSGSADER